MGPLLTSSNSELAPRIDRASFSSALHSFPFSARRPPGHGWFDTSVALQLNMGFCTLLLMDSLNVIPTEEVRDVTVQLVTYNGNHRSAYGSIHINFDFDHGERRGNGVRRCSVVVRHVLLWARWRFFFVVLFCIGRGIFFVRAARGINRGC